MTNIQRFRPLPLVVALQAIFVFPAYAQFTLAPGATDNAGKTLAGAAGVVSAGATLSTSGGTAAVTVNAGTSSITNSGTITQTGSGRTIDANTGTPNLTITNNAGGLISAAGGEVIRVNRPAGSYLIDNQGTIWQTSTTAGGSRAIKADAAFNSTGNQIINGSANNRNAIIRSDANDAIRLGNNFTLTNYGSILSTGVVNTSCPDYLQAQCVNDLSAADGVAIENGRSNVVILNHGSIVGPRHGIDGGDPVAATANANLLGADRLVVTSTGPNGVTFDRTENGVTTSGVKIDNPVVINYAGGTILGKNGSGVGFDGHGVVINYGSISGDYAGAGKVYDHEGLGLTTSNGDGDGVDIDGIAYVENYGRIQGLGAGGLDSGGNPNGADGIAAGGGTIVNHAGATIFGQSKAILIDDGANGTAIAAQRGTLAATGGIAKIFNDGNITAEKGAAIGLVGNYNDSIVNGATGVISGGANAVQVDVATSVTPAAAIQMGAGDDSLSNYGRIEGRNGLAIDMGTGNDTVRLFGGQVIGSIDGGAGNDTLETGGVQNFAAGSLRNFENYIVRNGVTTFAAGLAATTLRVDSGAALQVNGALSSSGNFALDGTLKAQPGAAPRTVAVGGNFALGASGVLEANLGAGNSADRIAASGSASLADGATVRPLAQGYVNNGASYTLVSASGGLTATPANLKLVNDSALVRYSLSQSGQDLVLTAQRNATLAASAGAGQAALGGALDALGQSGAAGSNSLLGQIDRLDSRAKVDDALRQLGSTGQDAGQQAAQLASSAMFSALDERMDLARGGNLAGNPASGLSAGDGSGRRAWVQGLGAWGEQKARGGASGYKIDAYGVAAGLETERSASEVMGLSFGFNHANADSSSGLGGDVKVKALSVGGYLNRQLPGMTLDLSATIGQNRYDASRRVAFGGFSDTLRADYKGWQAGAQVEAGFPFTLGADLNGRWLVGGRAAYLSNDGYTEQGSAGAALRVDASHATSVQSVLGAELTRAISPSSSLQLRARYLHEFGDTPDIGAAFVAGGPGFTLPGAQANRNTLQLGVALRHQAAQGVTITLRYDADVKDQYLSHRLTARANWAF